MTTYKVPFGTSVSGTKYCTISFGGVTIDLMMAGSEPGVFRVYEWIHNESSEIIRKAAYDSKNNEIPLFVGAFLFDIKFENDHAIIKTRRKMTSMYDLDKFYGKSEIGRFVVS